MENNDSMYNTFLSCLSQETERQGSLNKGHFSHVSMICMYSSPPLIRPPCLPSNCGHREVAFGEREK